MKFICIGPLCWGMGQDIQTAVIKAKQSRPKAVKGRTMAYFVFETADDAFVLPNGRIVTDQPVRQVREVRYVGQQRIVKDEIHEVQGVQIGAAVAASRS